VQQSFPENPDPAREKTIEPPNFPDPRFQQPDLQTVAASAMIPDLVASVN
jgi:hypothetical protein